MFTDTWLGAEPSADAAELSRLPWWFFLLTGVAWTWFAFIVLSFNFRTVWAVALFAGFSFLAAGINELVVASSIRSWRWAHALLAVLSIGAAVVAFVWPAVTFVALAAIIGWLLLFQGTFDVITSLAYRPALWGLRLAAGIVEIAVAFWAIGYPGRSFTLLAVWVAAVALTRGIGQILLAMMIRDHDRARASAAGGEGAIDLTEDSDRSAWNRQVIDEFHANHGRVGGDLEGQPVLLLHSRGAKSGQERVNPLTYQREGDSVVIFATKAGSPNNPDWYHNLVANPRAVIELGDQVIEVAARVADPAERDRLWNRQKEGMPGFAEYERTSGGREIPVIILAPVGARISG
jgi:deazaflavin-dependent oxidoreductase (nitroreductase family)